MDKVSILTASRHEPSVSLHGSPLLAYLYHTVPYAAIVQHALRSASLFLCFQAYALASITLTTALYVSKILALQAYLATKVGAFHAGVMSGWAVSEVYRSKTLHMLRRKLFFEFAVFILGGGQTLFLVIFWPGWIVVGAGVTVWQFLG